MACTTTAARRCGLAADRSSRQSLNGSGTLPIELRRPTGSGRAEQEPTADGQAGRVADSPVVLEGVEFSHRMVQLVLGDSLALERRARTLATTTLRSPLGQRDRPSEGVDTDEDTILTDALHARLDAQLGGVKLGLCALGHQSDGELGGELSAV